MAQAVHEAPCGAARITARPPHRETVAALSRLPAGRGPHDQPGAGVAPMGRGGGRLGPAGGLRAEGRFDGRGRCAGRASLCGSARGPGPVPGGPKAALLSRGAGERPAGGWTWDSCPAKCSSQACRPNPTSASGPAPGGAPRSRSRPRSCRTRRRRPWPLAARLVDADARRVLATAVFRVGAPLRPGAALRARAKLPAPAGLGPWLGPVRFGLRWSVMSGGRCRAPGSGDAPGTALGRRSSARGVPARRPGPGAVRRPVDPPGPAGVGPLPPQLGSRWRPGSRGPGRGARGCAPRDGSAPGAPVPRGAQLRRP